MKKRAVLLSLLIPLMFTNQVRAVRQVSVPSQEMIVEAKEIDVRAEVLRDYLAQYNSPLTDYSQDFIEAADQYGVDWKLVPAISGVESTFGKDIPGGYNGWGWGVYQDQAIYFKSWREGIYTVTKGIRENYLDKGLTNPYSINSVYASSPTWGAHVSYFLSDINSFSKKYPITDPLALSNLSKEKNIAASSAKLAKSSPRIKPSESVLAFR